MTYCISEREKRKISFYEKQNSINFIFSIHSTHHLSNIMEKKAISKDHIVFLQQRSDIDEIIRFFFSREYLTDKKRRSYTTD